MTWPFLSWPMVVYSSIPGGSWIHSTCFCSSLQMVVISSLNKGTPRVSVACERARSKASISSVVFWVPHVLCLQCLLSSSFEMACLTALSDGFDSPANVISLRLALMRRLWSSLSHSKMHWDSLDIKVPYKGWASLVQRLANLLIKCQMSRCMMRSCHWENSTLTKINKQNFLYHFFLLPQKLLLCN